MWPIWQGACLVCVKPVVWSQLGVIWVSWLVSVNSSSLEVKAGGARAPSQSVTQSSSSIWDGRPCLQREGKKGAAYVRFCQSTPLKRIIYNTVVFSAWKALKQVALFWPYVSVTDTRAWRFSQNVFVKLQDQGRALAWGEAQTNILLRNGLIGKF